MVPMLTGIIALTLADVASIAGIFGSLSLVVSVWFLFREVRENNKLTRASNTQTLVNLSCPFYLALIQDREMATIYLHGGRSLEEMDEVDRHRYRSLITWWLIFHENVFYQWRNGLLDQHSYKPWATDLRLFVYQQRIGPHWDDMKHLFQDEFANHIDGLLASETKPADRKDVVV